MIKHIDMVINRRQVLAVALVSCIAVTGCGPKQEGAAGGGAAGAAKVTSVQNIGSDTMVNLAQAWAEKYHSVDPTVSVEVSGGGSGIGVAALINGTCDIANCSRALEPEEVEKAKTKHGHEPKEYLVGFDALAIYVHPSNPMTEISVEELSEIYKEGGKIEKWSQLGATLPGGEEIIRISRQNNSGTYHYFREMVVGKKSDMKLGSRDMNGSKDVVELVARTPNSIGYSGLGYSTDKVKILKVAKTKGGSYVVPSIESTWDKSYPIARPMFMYTPGQPAAHVQKYLDWVISDAGQVVVKESGYVPLPKK
ncbi:MAG: phosphate ABC transporter substrate-binding protein [Verrucomicrobiales bacterium]|nr:phosphate ABC transporter substrate-binding protein [Verrucomicrobiales bacterium]